MQKLIITCAKSKLAKQADEELQFGLSSIGPKARQMLVLRPAGELQQIMLKEDELRQAMLRREKQMKAAEHAIKQHQLLVAEMATDHSTQSGPGSVGGSGSVKKAQSARSWLERARQASDLSAQGALKKMTAAQLRKQLATIEALLRRGVKDGLVAPRDGHISAPPVRLCAVMSLRALPSCIEPLRVAPHTRVHVICSSPGTEHSSPQQLQSCPFLPKATHVRFVQKSGIEEARPKVAGQNPKTDSNREGFEGPGRASTGAQVSSAGSRRPARAELAQTSPATLETGGSAGKEIKMASALDRAARSVVASMGKTNQALTSSLARRVQALTREEARGLRQVQQAELEEKQVLPHGLSHAIQMRRRDEDEATRLQRLRTAELQSEPDTDEVGQ